jgi:PAS domain S-box-containing protein
MVVIIDADQKVTLVNNKGCEILGYKEEEIIGKNWFDNFLPERLRDGVKFIHSMIMAEDIKPVEYYENEILSKSGDERLIAWYNTVFRDKKGNIMAVLSSGGDITERRQLEKKIIEIEEIERRRIGHDLHDDMGQQLTGISFKSQYLENQLKEKQIPEAEIAAKLTSLIDKARDSMENLSQELSPILVKGEKSLWMAMKELAFNTEKIFNIPCIFKCDENVRITNRLAAINLYRIAQEAVTNAAKHAAPRSIEISLYRENNKIIITIKDDGTGISGTEDKADGMGLRIMHYRADMIGARLNVRPDVNGGTIVECIYTDKTESGTGSSLNKND